MKFLWLLFLIVITISAVNSSNIFAHSSIASCYIKHSIDTDSIKLPEKRISALLYDDKHNVPKLNSDENDLCLVFFWRPSFKKCKFCGRDYRVLCDCGGIPQKPQK